MEEEKRLYSDRSGTTISVDTPDIVSDCQVISFINDGDTPCYIVSADGKVRRFLDQFQEVSFGSDRPGILERTAFAIEFQAVVTTKKVYVERVKYASDPYQC